MFKFAVLLSLVAIALGGAKMKALKGEIAGLKELYSQVLEDTSGSLDELEAAITGVIGIIDEFKAAQAQKDIDLAWQSLHMAGAAACRGSTPQGGKGPWSNSVIPKENGKKCSTPQGGKGPWSNSVIPKENG